MIRIFIFNNACRAANYGIGTYISQLADALSVYTDIEVAFVNLLAETKELTTTKDEYKRVHYSVPSLSMKIESDMYCRSVFYLLARYINIKDTDQLVFHFNYFHHFPLASLLKGQYPNSRIIFTVHYMNWCFELNGNLSHMHKIMLKDSTTEKERLVKNSIFDERKILHLADEIIVLSKKTLSILFKDYNVSKDKLHLVYNGIGNEPITKKVQTNSRNILFVGRLDKIKGVEYLIDAFAMVAPNHADAHLNIIGDGAFQPYLSRCRKLQGRVSFFGKTLPKEVEQVYQSTYIGVIPSFHEQCSCAVIEMMRHGIPIIGTDSTGLNEMLDATPNLRIHIDEDTFCEQDFVTQISTRLEMLLSDKTTYDRASTSISRLYEKRYKSHTMAAKTKEIFKASFERPNYTISIDYFKHLDSNITQLINQCPDITTDYFGMSGIGVYLWWRILSLEHKEIEEFQMLRLQEYLIYYLDWLYEVTNDTPLPKEMLATLTSMKWHKFYKTKVDALLSSQQATNLGIIPTEKDIIYNALKICNCKV